MNESKRLAGGFAGLLILLSSMALFLVGLTLVHVLLAIPIMLGLRCTGATREQAKAISFLIVGVLVVAPAGYVFFVRTGSPDASWPLAIGLIIGYVGAFIIWMAEAQDEIVATSLQAKLNVVAEELEMPHVENMNEAQLDAFQNYLATRE